MIEIPTIRRTMGAAEWGTLLILSVVWGGSFFFIEVALTAFPPLTIVALRVAIGALCLHGTAIVLGWQLPRGQKVWISLAAMGVLCNVIPFSLIVWGQTHIGGGLAAILNTTTPLFSVFTAHFLTHDERMTATSLAGVVLGLTGAIVLLGPTELLGLGTGLFAQLAVLAAAQSYALAAVFGRRFARMGLSANASARGQLTMSALLLLPLAAWWEQPWTLAMPGLVPWSALIALGSISTAFAFILYFRVLATSGATNITLVTFLVPVSAILLGSTVLGEILLPRHFAGMALIGVAFMVIDGRPVAAAARWINGRRN